MECKICKELREVFKCDGCETSVCKHCGKLTSSEVKVLQLSNRVMKFHCPCCRGNDSYTLLNRIIENKEEIIKSREELIEMLRGEIEELKARKVEEVQRKSYRDAVVKAVGDVIVVKPKNSSQESSRTKRVIEEKIDPSVLGVGISRVKYVREGGIAIKCNGQQSSRNVCEKLQQQIGGEYEVQVPKRKNPKIKILNVDKKMLDDQEDLIEKIIIQNCIKTPDEHRIIKIVGGYENRAGKTCAVLEVDPTTYGYIKKKEILYIGWRAYRYIEHINVVQCYRCWKFGHMAKECKSEKGVCPKCAGDHKSDECQAVRKVCVNCRHASEVLKVPDLSLDHAAFDRKCVAYIKIYSRLQERVKYPDLYNHESQ